MKNFKSNLPYLLLAILAIILAVGITKPKESEEITYSEFRKIAFESNKKVEKVSIDDSSNKVILHLANDKIKYAKLPRSQSGYIQLADELTKQGINTSIEDSKTGEIISILLFQIGPLIILLPLLFFMMRGLQSGGGQAFNFIKSKAKLLGEQKTKITFANVAGVDEAKQELQEIVEFLKDGEKFRALGAKIPKGVLLVGPPGTGKTLLAKAVAGEAGVPFFSISGSDFVEMFVGVGASRVRDLFEQARKQAPCIIFVDEIDAVGRQRGVTMGGHDEREQTLNQLLVEMDGFESSNTNIILLAATNRPDILDRALTRPGRFDRQVIVDYPDIRGREAILKVHSEGKILTSEMDLKVLAKRTPGFTGADLANMMNEAALIAASKNKKQIEMLDFEEAIDKVYLGSKRMIKVPFHQMEMIAYHETGHALISLLTEKDETGRKEMPFHKVTIIPRSKAAGVSWSIDKEDHVHWTKKSLSARIKVALGGMAAEEIIYNDTSTGVVSDLQNATKIARRMITQFGMSDLGPIAYGEERESFLGDFGHSKDYSEEVAKQIDQRVKDLINKSFAEVKDTLNTNRSLMEAVATELLDKETLERDDVLDIVERVKNNTYDFEEAKERINLLQEKIKNKEEQENKDHEEEIRAKNEEEAKSQDLILEKVKEA
jgi:cell division protease FtsH